MARILVADDNSNIQKMVALALEERGIDVVSVGNGEAAVRRIPDLAPDLILADVFMPVRNGYEVCEFVKTNQRFSHVPVILLVGAFDPLDEKEARRVGADGVLKKPFVPPDPLIAMVTSALEKNPKAVSESSQAHQAAAPAAPRAETHPPQVDAPARPAPQPLREYAKQTADTEPTDETPVYGFEKAKEKSNESSFTPRFSSPEMQASDDEFDTTATASDWRRTAANFEVPEDLNGEMAVTPNETFHAAAFPSEHEVPPRRIPVAQDDHHEEPSAPAPEQVSENEFPGFESTPSQSGGFTPHFEPSPESQAHADQGHPAPIDHEESVPKNAADALPSPSEYAEDGWMSSLLDKFRHHKTEHEEKEEAAIPAESLLPKPAAAPESESLSRSEGSTPAAAPVEDKSEQFFAPEIPSAASGFAPPPPALEESEPPHQGLSAFSPEPAHNLLAAPADVDNGERPAFREAPEPAVVSHEAEFDSDEAQNVVSSNELLETDTNATEGSFFASSMEEHVDHNSIDHPATQFTPTAPGFTAVPIESASEEPAAPGAANAEVSDRIPTAPPPSREALADIPFLTPPPPAPFAPVSSEHKPAQPETTPSVDAVVNRLLERLEPQLHEMLTKDLLKPLVQNLLNQELQEKSK